MSHRADNVGWYKDRSASFAGGVDGSRNASDIDRDQVAFAVNATFRSGPAKPRFGYHKIPLTFSDGDVEAAFKGGRFQQASYYDGSDTPMLLSVHSGRAFKIDLYSMLVTEITPRRVVGTTLTVDFTIPAFAGTDTVTVASTFELEAGMTATIGYYPVFVVSVDTGTTFTARNDTLANAGILIHQPISVTWSFPDPSLTDINLGWSIQFENYWAYQDNVNLPLIFDGNVSRRSSLVDQEVPTGNVMGYGLGRLIVALPNRQSFRIGDLVFGSSGTPGNGYRDAVLKFTENNFLNEGGDEVARVFGANANNGRITAISPLAMLDTNLGQGPMVVATPLQIFTLNLPFDRTQWKNMASAIQTVSPIIGPLGQSSCQMVNGDLWYRGVDGIRSFFMARRDFSQWGNTPMSAEIDDIMSADTKELLENGSACLFDNRLFHTCSPVSSVRGVWHRGMVVIDFFQVSGIRRKTQPAWDGLWVGPRIFKCLSAYVNRKERGFFYSLDDNEEISLYEILPAAIDDDGVSISWALELPSFNFGSDERYKRLESGRLVINNLEGDVIGTVKYRSDLNPCWQTWDTFSICSKIRDCGEEGTTHTTASFKIPAAGATRTVQVTSTAGMFVVGTGAYPITIHSWITIGDYSFILDSVDSATQITVRNMDVSQEGNTVDDNSVVTFHIFDCTGPVTYRPQVRAPIRLRMPPDTFDQISRHKYRTGYEFQPRLEFNGYFELKRFWAYAKDEPEALGAEWREQT